MRTVHVLVEGQTEEAFVSRILSPHFSSLNTYLQPIIIKTKRTASKAFKGGINKYDQVKGDLVKLLRNSSLSAVTTMIDYYDLPNDFPDYGSLPDGSCYDKVAYLQAAFRADIDDERFIPFITLHEFEALLFVQPAEIAGVLSQPSRRRSAAIELTKIRQQFNSPEEIDGGSTTHPSARIRSQISQYQKPVDGILIAQRIGLNSIRAECPHFNDWLSQLESLPS